LKAEDVSRPAITLASNKSLQDLRNVLLRYRISRAIIEQDEKPIGIITEKDVSRFLYSGVTNKPMHEISLLELLPKRPLISVNKYASLAECAKKMIGHGISSLVVTDYDGKTVGIFTKTDLLDFYTKRLAGRATVGEYMSKNVQTVRPDDPAHSALVLMAEKGISRVIVVSHDKPVGIITGRDLLRVIPLMHRLDILQKENKKEVYIPAGSIATIEAANVMKPLPITITDYSDLADAAMIMKGNKISGLPVVNSSDKLVGVITSTDVIRAISQMEKSDQE
jgi:CBS domain-containing protein